MGQTFEAGGAIGAGVFAVSSGGGAAAGEAGADLCVGCSGRFAFFVDYRHWLTAARTGEDRVKSADLGSFGLRIQSKSSTRFFFDIGLAGGRDRHIFSGHGGGMVGVVLGAGVEIPLHGPWSLSPQVRAYGLSPHSLEGVDAHWALGAELGVSYRF